MSSRITTETIERWMKEVSDRPSASDFDKSSVLKRLGRELDYCPPGSDSFEKHLERIMTQAQERALAPKADYPDGVRIRNQHEMLAALDVKLTAFLDGVNYVSNVDEVAEIMKRREAARFILSTLPAEALINPKLARHDACLDDIDSFKMVVRERELKNLQKWADRLELEHGRIKSEIDETAARGLMDRFTNATFRKHPLWCDLADVGEELVNTKITLIGQGVPQRLAQGRGARSVGNSLALAENESPRVA
jgi:hypothetical protein